MRIFATLGRHPRLFRAWLRFAATLMFRGESRTDGRLITLRTAWRCGSWYEWVRHAALAERAGLAAADIERTVEGPTADGWRPRQRLLLQATNELHDLRAITDRTWQALSAEKLDDRELVELFLLVGHYDMLAMTLNSLGVEPEASALAKLTGPSAEAAGRLPRRAGGGDGSDCSGSGRRSVQQGRAGDRAGAGRHQQRGPPLGRLGGGGGGERHAEAGGVGTLRTWGSTTRDRSTPSRAASASRKASVSGLATTRSTSPGCSPGRRATRRRPRRPAPRRLPRRIRGAL